MGLRRGGLAEVQGQASEGAGDPTSPRRDGGAEKVGSPRAERGVDLPLSLQLESATVQNHRPGDREKGRAGRGDRGVVSPHPSAHLGNDASRGHERPTNRAGIPGTFFPGRHGHLYADPPYPSSRSGEPPDLRRSSDRTAISSSICWFRVRWLHWHPALAISAVRTLTPTANRITSVSDMGVRFSHAHYPVSTLFREGVTKMKARILGMFLAVGLLLALPIGQAGAWGWCPHNPQIKVACFHRPIHLKP